MDSEEVLCAFVRVELELKAFRQAIHSSHAWPKCFRTVRSMHLLCCICKLGSISPSSPSASNKRPISYCLNAIIRKGKHALLKNKLRFDVAASGKLEKLFGDKESFFDRN